MKTYKEQQRIRLRLWDAFVEFMESIFWKDCLSDFSSEQINFYWEDFKKTVSA